MKKTILIVLGAILIIFGLLVPLTTTLVTFLLPETFAATARIAPSSTNPMAVAAEVQRIQSQVVLDQVITNLNLGAEWGRKFKQAGDLPSAMCYAILKGSIRISQLPNTRLIEIGVFDDNKDEAAVIANKIAAVYLSLSPGATVIESAEPNSKPVRPNKPLNIVLGLLVGSAFAGLGIFLISVARKNKPS